MTDTLKHLVIGSSGPDAFVFADFLRNSVDDSVTLAVPDKTQRSMQGADVSSHPSLLTDVVKQLKGTRSFDSIVLFDLDESMHGGVIELLKHDPTRRLFIVSSVEAHLGNRAWREAERRAIARIHSATSDVTVIRAPHLSLIGEDDASVSNHDSADRNFTARDLHHVVISECQRPQRNRPRILTLLGPCNPRLNGPHRDAAFKGSTSDNASQLPQDDSSGVVHSSGRWIHAIRPRARRRGVDTLTPSSVSELLAIYNPYNIGNVQLAGYNTGVKHFGWSFPGKTVVKTIETGKLQRLSGDLFQVDAGMTLKQAAQYLNGQGKEFLVVPNYSYISMGTCFFVPIHGSGSQYSTLGETIEKALLYLPDEDRMLVVKRGDAAFERFLYCPNSRALVLRLTFRVRDKTRYFMKESKVNRFDAADIVRELNDPDAANVEIRKSHAADDSITIRKYYEEGVSESSPEKELLELPKDSLGRVWDRLEETPVVSQLFHQFVKRYGYHVELFLNEAEFDCFWESHTDLPIRKIQLRRMKRDGMRHSPCRDSDQISADLFMKRVDKDRFLDYIDRRLPQVRFNPGKHSK